MAKQKSSDSSNGQPSPKRANTESTPQRANVQDPQLISPPNVIKQASHNGQIEELLSSDTITKMIQHLNSNKTPEPKNAEAVAIRRPSEQADVHLFCVRVGNGNMHVVWGEIDDQGIKRPALPWDLQNLAKNTTEEGRQLRERLGCNSNWVNRCKPGQPRKSLKQKDEQHGWKAMFSWNRTKQSHDTFVPQMLDAFGTLFEGQGNVVYDIHTSDILQGKYQPNNYPRANECITDYSLSQVINCTFYQKMLLDQCLMPNTQTDKKTKKETVTTSKTEYELPGVFRQLFFTTKPEFADFFYTPTASGTYSNEAKKWGYP